MNFKKYFYVTIGSIAVLLLIITSFVILVDPYQQYHASNKFMANQRHCNPGIAKHHDYNAVIVGSSMAMNHYPSQVDSLFGWNTINLTTMGATDADYNLLFPYIAKTGKAKHMIWCLDYFSFYRTPTTYLLEPYLYDNNWYNDYPYWLNYTSFKESLTKLVKTKQAKSRDGIYYFYSPSSKDCLLENYKRNNNHKYFEKDNFAHIKTRFEVLEKTVLSLLSETEIYIYLPPYSILEFKMLEEYGHWEKIKAFKQYMIERLLKKNNIKIYDFQKEEFICDFDEYMDLQHHSHTYNKRIIEYIAKDCCRVTINNYIKDLEILDSLVSNYKIKN